MINLRVSSEVYTKFVGFITQDKDNSVYYLSFTAHELVCLEKLKQTSTVTIAVLFQFEFSRITQ